MKQNTYILIFLLILTIENIFVSKAQEKKEYAGPVDILNDMAPKINENADLYTGRCNIQIPLYTYQDKDFTIPISLQYASTGFKINQPIGHTGLGWNLNYGGSIVRTINGAVDEYGSGLVGSYWLYHNANTGEKDDRTLIDNGCVNSEKVAYASPIYCWNTNNELVNTETTPDVFSFNFGDHKGSFCLGPNNSIYVFNTNHPHGEYKVEVTRTQSSNPSYKYGKLNFKITTGDGYSYFFDGRKGEDYGSNSVSRAFNTYIALDGDKWQITPLMEWYLVEIKAPNGRTVTFEYGNPERNESSQPTFGTDATWGDNFQCGNFPYVCDGFEIRQSIVFPIKKISIDNTSIDFEYEQRLKEPFLVSGKKTSPYSYLGELLTISRLKSMRVKEKSTSSVLRTCSFSYHYSNTNTTEYNIWYYGRPVLFLENIEISGEGSYQMDYYNESDLYPLMGQGSDHWGYYCDNTSTQAPPEFTDNNYRESHYDEFNFYKVLSGMLQKITYPTGGYTKYYYDEHTIDSKVTKDLTHNNNPYLAPGGLAGGVRIKRITNYANSNDSVYREFNYVYDDGAYSGILLHSPRYYRKVDANPTNSDNIKNCYGNIFYPSQQEIFSSYGNYTHTQDQTHVAYSEVIENFPDGSYTIYTYSDYKLLPDLEYDKTMIKKISEIQSSTPAYPDNFYAQYDSRHTQRGKLIAKRQFSNQYKLVYSEEYKYNYNKALKYVPTVKLAYSYFYLSKLFVDDYPLEQVVKITYPQNSNQNPVIETASLVYNDLGQIIDETVTNSTGQSISVKMQFINDISSVSRESVHNNMVAKNIIDRPVRIQTSVLNSGVIAGGYFKFKSKDNGFIYLAEEQKAKISTPLSSSNFQFDSYLKVENSYIYDDVGNIIQETDKRGMNTVYIRSGIYLLAEIQNASLDQVKSISGLNNIQNKLNIDKLSQTQINALYDIVGTHVTVWEYKPMVGVSMIIDSKKSKTFFFYDNDGRLIETRDNDDNVISRNKYHYKK
ncbi:MAG: hypothetical protein LBI82_05230 [Dysgonamonadaceae bacterium]|jgi:hypothetical protein|nr:hypothetical protein [Dysgonamonadaceae bacterium]